MTAADTTPNVMADAEPARLKRKSNARPVAERGPCPPSPPSVEARRKERNSMSILSGAVKLLALPFAVVEDVVTFVPRSMSDSGAKPRTIEVIEKAAEEMK